MPKGVYVRNKALRPQTFKACCQCGEVFGPVDHLAVKFCSTTCAANSRTGRASPLKGKRMAHRDRARIGNCLTCGGVFRAVADHHRRKQLYCSHRCYLANRRVSHFEIAVFDHLASMGIDCDRTVRVGRWTFDGRLRLAPVVLIEADGKYWHSFQVTRERDARKNAWCAANGYELLRVSEEAFMVSPSLACDVIVSRWEKATGLKAERIPAE